MVQEHTPPRLSDEGAQLLADVLAKRNINAAEAAVMQRSRRDTLTAQANARGRTRDPLGSSATPAVDVVDVSATGRTSVQPAPNNRRSLPLTVLLAGMGLGALIVCLTMVLAPRLQSSPTVEVAGVAEQQPQESSIPIDTRTGLEIERPLRLSTSTTLARTASTTQSSTAPTSVMDPSAIEVTVSDIATRIGGVRSFALELSAVRTQTAVGADEFEVVVEQSDGTPVLTAVQFEQPTLAVGSSVSATVRAGGTTVGDLSVVVRLGDVEISRIRLV